MGPDLLPPSHLSALWSGLLVYGLAGALLGATLAFAAHRLRAHARAATKAEADEARPPALAPGRAFLCGVVETDDDRPAVELTLWEEGSEWKEKSRWFHRWKERSRHLEVRPFTLRLPRGEAVRVLPDERVSLVDTVHTRAFTGRERERRAEIVAGEHVCLDGVLLWNRRGHDRTAYRGGSDTGATPFVLRRPRAEPLLIASGGLAAGHRRWAAWYLKATIALAALFAVLHLGFLEYHALRVAGVVVPRARVVDQRTYTTRHKRGLTTHLLVRAEVDLPGRGAVQVEEELAHPIYAEPVPQLREIPLQIVPRLPWAHQAGTEPRISTDLAVLGTVLSVVALWLFWSLRRRATPWYEQRRVVERGEGTLAMSVQREEAEASAAVRREVI